MTKEIQNRINMLFPSLANKVEGIENSNTLTTDELWQGVSDKFADKVKRIIAPLDGIIMDISTDLQVKNADALPVVQVETVNSVGNVLKNTSTWDDTALNSSYTNVQTCRLSRPFTLSYSDLTKGHVITSKVTAAAEKVAQGVIAELAGALEDIDTEYISDFNSEAACAIGGVFTNEECNALILSPAQYAKIVPSNALGLNPESEGVYGIKRIYKSTGLGDILACTASSIAGVIATPQILENHPGDCDIRLIGDIAGFPMVLKSKWDTWAECIKCSVEVLCGFAVVNADGVRKYAVGEEPTPSNYQNGPQD